ncbi:hypothetical protein JRQ81_014935 [Phrynocephalus forsythii]|uniref:Uncharacterized protein n=1 Tax=Phrynocephalus forsythii TaxID=171643 RepID=A0A9Q0XZL5_9SAUR|nr:hypothetical protein JRQ81_014935 [Phrynocephalus forsythii]
MKSRNAFRPRAVGGRRRPASPLGTWEIRNASGGHQSNGGERSRSRIPNIGFIADCGFGRKIKTPSSLFALLSGHGQYSQKEASRSENRCILFDPHRDPESNQIEAGSPRKRDSPREPSDVEKRLAMVGRGGPPPPRLPHIQIRSG